MKNFLRNYRLDYLSSDRSQFLTEAEEATKLTLPYLIRGHEEHARGMKQIKTIVDTTLSTMISKLKKS